MSAYIKYLIAIFALLFLLLIVDNVSHYHVLSTDENVYQQDSLVVHIGIRSGYNKGKGHPQGFNYQLLSDCSKHIGREFVMPHAHYSERALDALASGGADIVALDVRDSLFVGYEDKILLTTSFYDYVWAVNKENTDLFTELNLWISESKDNGYMKRMRNRFFSTYSLKPYIATMTTRTGISPYDSLIKVYSKDLGWDWRLLSAVVRKESRFSIGVVSSRGAMGLMQVLPSTAAVFGIKDCYSPENNIKAGTLFLQTIKRSFEKAGLDSSNVVKFTLAAYNAGRSRIQDCIAFAQEQGTDTSDWDSVARVIPLMSLPEYYKEAGYLRHGSFSGRETLAYVRDILTYYKEYQQAVRP